MNRIWLVLVVVLALISRSQAEDQKQDTEKKVAAATPAEKFKANPGDKEAFNAFAQEYITKISMLIRTNPLEAEKKLTEMNAVLDSLGTVEGDGKQFVSSARSAASFLKNSIDVAKTSLAEMETKLDANPHDMTALTSYFRKANMELSSLVRSEPEKAEKLLASIKQRLEKALTGLTKEDEKNQVQGFIKSLAGAERILESTKKMAALIGQDAAPLDIEAWVNGSPLTDADLKGKVVLLDFWAVWCGPCIATFPHLREWNDKYGGKDLVIIGVTNYYQKYGFDSEKGSLKQATEPLTPEAEQEMLKSFAQHHDLHHRFAVASKESKMASYYGVSGIPHVVIIDQAGKIRMMKVGSGEANAKALHDMLESLINKSPAAGG